MRTLPEGWAAAVQQTAVGARVYVIITARDRSSGDPVTYALASEPDDGPAQVVDPDTGETEQYTFHGGAIEDWPEINQTSGDSIVAGQARLMLNPLDPTVEQMIRGDDVRGVPIIIYIGPVDPRSNLQLAPAVDEFVGTIDHVDFVTAAEGGTSRCELTLIDETQQFTLGSPELRSHAAQQLRSAGDTALKTSDAMRSIAIFWGEEKIQAGRRN